MVCMVRCRGDVPRRLSRRGRKSGRRLFFALAANDASSETDPGWDYQIETATVAVRPDSTDLDPLCLLLAAFFWIDDDVGGMGWLAAHDASPFVVGPPQRGLDASLNGAVPGERRGEARERDHPVCRSQAPEKRGHPRRGRSPCPAAARCAVQSANRGLPLDVAAGEESVVSKRPLPLSSRLKPRCRSWSDTAILVTHRAKSAASDAQSR